MAGLNNKGTSNSTTDVTVVAAPGASTSRLIPKGGITVYNNDTVAATVTLQFHVTTPTDTILEQAIISPGKTYINSMPIVLDATDESLEIYLSAAVTTNQLDWFTHYRDEAQ